MNVATLTLTITRTPDGTVEVGGPLNDLGVCYALLELARDAIKAHYDQQQRSGLVRANALPSIPR